MLNPLDYHRYTGNIVKSRIVKSGFHCTKQNTRSAFAQRYHFIKWAGAFLVYLTYKYIIHLKRIRRTDYPRIKLSEDRL